MRQLEYYGLAPMAIQKDGLFYYVEAHGSFKKFTVYSPNGVFLYENMEELNDFFGSALTDMQKKGLKNASFIPKCVCACIIGESTALLKALDLMGMLCPSFLSVIDDDGSQFRIHKHIDTYMNTFFEISSTRNLFVKDTHDVAKYIGNYVDTIEFINKKRYTTSTVIDPDGNGYHVSLVYDKRMGIDKIRTRMFIHKWTLVKVAVKLLGLQQRAVIRVNNPKRLKEQGFFDMEVSE